MNKILVVMLSVVIGVVCGSALVVTGSESEEDLCIPLGNLVLEAPEGVEAQRSPVEFPHSQHFGINCKSCHHKWDGGAEFLSCGTAGCHDLAEAPKKGEPDPKFRYYKNAYHKSCIGCHKTMKAENKRLEMTQVPLGEELPRTGPTGCNKCHPDE